MHIENMNIKIFGLVCRKERNIRGVTTVASTGGSCFNFRLCSITFCLFCIQYFSKVSYHLLSRFSRDQSLICHETIVLFGT